MTLVSSILACFGAFGIGAVIGFLWGSEWMRANHGKEHPDRVLYDPHFWTDEKIKRVMAAEQKNGTADRMKPYRTPSIPGVEDGG